jgi:hypothetical protein
MANAETPMIGHAMLLGLEENTISSSSIPSALMPRWKIDTDLVEEPMKKLLFAASFGLILTAGVALAQPPRATPQPATTAKKAKPAVQIKTGEAALNGLSMSEVTPEMWIYMQEAHRHDDPKMAVRRKAEFRAMQRARRIAAREWFGYSNSRPTVNPDPYTAGYSAHWSSNSAMRPDQWIGNNRSVVTRYR